MRPATRTYGSKIEQHGNVAVLAYEAQEHLDYHGQILQSRYRINDTWLKTGQGWQLLAEQVAAVLKDPPSVKLTQQQLCEYDGSYSLTAESKTTIRCTADGLTAERSGRPAAPYLAEVQDVFFLAGQPRTRRIFVRDAQGKVTGFVDRREGEDVRWTRKLFFLINRERALAAREPSSAAGTLGTSDIAGLVLLTAGFAVYGAFTLLRSS